MAQTAAIHNPLAGIVLPGILLVGLLGLIAAQTGLLTVPAATASMTGPETVTIAPREYSYRDSGEFQRNGANIDGPLVTVERPAPLEIMKFQVSDTDYARCVADGACEATRPLRRGTGNVAVTGVSFDDATAYAAWLSAKTDESWRLPTIAEWVFAAGSKARDDALGIETEKDNPADRWLAFYERESALGANALTTPEPLGSAGINEFGVADLSAAVWEWSSTCDSRTTLGAAGEILSRVEACGVRLLEGRHRAPMSAFVRDARTGGCSVGAPPDNLGFRLVKERNWWWQIADVLTRIAFLEPSGKPS